MLTVDGVGVNKAAARTATTHEDLTDTRAGRGQPRELRPVALRAGRATDDRDLLSGETGHFELHIFNSLNTSFYILVIEEH